MRFLILSALLLATVPAAHAAETKGPFVDVPKNHWGYEAVTAMEQSGVFTGYPRGTFAGQRALTRYEFAVAVQRIGTDLSRDVAGGGASTEQQLRVAALDRLGLLRKPEPPGFLKLVDEFEPELKLLGSSAERVKSALAYGKEAKSIPPAPASPSKEYARGVREARDQWMRGEVVIYTAGLPAASFDDKLAVPHRQVAGCVFGQETRELMAGHNSEVYRLALERGLPANHRREWLAELKDPARLWAGDRAPRAMLTPGGGFATAPNGTVRARVRAEGKDFPHALEVQRDGKTIATMGLGSAKADAPAPEIAWAAGGELLFVRYSTNANEGSGIGHLVFDVRTATVVARGFSSGSPK